MVNEILFGLIALILSILAALAVMAFLLRTGHIIPWQVVAAFVSVVVFVLALVGITRWMERR